LSKGNAVITIDGPAGTGKTTMARLLARELGMRYLNTGAMYRAFALHAIRAGIDSKAERLKELLDDFSLRIQDNKDTQRVILKGEDVTHLISDPSVERLASELSRLKEVRELITLLQRKEAEKGDLVAEGRDMGSVVFPHAQVKFFLTASPEVRAQRRWNERIERGESITYEEVLNELLARDEQDTKREIAPLKPALGAIVVDTTHLGIEEVLEILLIHSKKVRTL